MLIKWEDVKTITKADAEELFKPLVASVLNGETNPVDAQSFFIILEKAIESAKPKLKQVLIDEVSKYPEGCNNNGIVFTVSHTGDRLDYSADPIVAELEAKLEKRKALLKSVTLNGVAVADTESGILAEPLKIKTYSQEIVKAQIK